MAEEPKSRRDWDAIFAMLRNPTPEQLAILTAGTTPLNKGFLEFLEFLRRMAAAQARLPDPPEPPPVDPEMEERMEGVKQLLHRMKHTRLVGEVQSVQVVSDNEPLPPRGTLKADYLRWLKDMPEGERKSLNYTQRARLWWQKQPGRGELSTLRALSRLYEADPIKK
jgi:hypothetical protein